MFGGVSRRTRRIVPAGTSTSFPSVAAIVPPPPMRTPSNAPFAPPMIPPMMAPMPAPAPIFPASPLMPSLSSACVTVQELQLSPSEFGLIGSSFFLLFSLSAIVTGFIVNRVQTRWALLVMGLVWALTQFPMLGAVGFATVVAWKRCSTCAVADDNSVSSRASIS